MSPVLEVDVEQRLGDFALRAAFTSSARSTALFGRSGAGKTSIVNLIAGLSRPRRGRIVVEGHILVDTAQGVFVPAHRRRIGYVFQEARLFPHFSVRRNLAFGSWFNGRVDPRTSARVIDLLGLGPLLDRSTQRLSGGERQRVALGRALLSSPRLLLMDEPLASLDAARKAEILPYIETVRDEAGVPIVYVSHAVPEIERLASTVVRIEAGRVAACGPAQAVLGLAQDEAEHVTVWQGVVEGVPSEGRARVRGAFGVLDVAVTGAIVAGSRVSLRIPARSVLLVRGEIPASSASAMVPAVVTSVTGGPCWTEIGLTCGAAGLTARVAPGAAARLAPMPGETLTALLAVEVSP